VLVGTGLGHQLGTSGLAGVESVIHRQPPSVLRPQELSPELQEPPLFGRVNISPQPVDRP